MSVFFYYYFISLIATEGLFVHVYTFILVHNCKHCRTRVTFLEKCGSSAI